MPPELSRKFYRKIKPQKTGHLQGAQGGAISTPYTRGRRGRGTQGRARHRPRTRRATAHTDKGTGRTEDTVTHTTETRRDTGQRTGSTACQEKNKSPYTTVHSDVLL